MNVEELESAKNLLALCYDSFEEVNDNLFIVSNEGKYGLVNIDNEIRYNFINDKISRVGNLVLVHKGYCYKVIDTSIMATTMELRDAKPCGKATIVSTGYCSYGIIGANGKFIMSPVYEQLKVNKETSKGIQVYVRYNQHQFIATVAPNGLSVDKLDEIETPDSRFRIVGIPGKARKGIVYELVRGYDFITNNEYDKIMYLKAYVPFGLVHTWKNGYAGLIRTNGQEIVSNNRFRSVDSIGFGNLYIVSERKDGKEKLGVFKEGKELHVNTVFDTTFVAKGVPIMYFGMKQADDIIWYILGNDGHMYKEVQKAFPIYKTEYNGNNIYSIEVYGRKYLVDGNIKPLTWHLEVKEGEKLNWTKLV